MAYDPETLVSAIRSSKPLLTRFFPGFDDSNHTAQAPGIPNHAAWTLGHLALYWYRGMQLLGGGDLPRSMFLTGDGTGGTPELFDTESICIGSDPVADPALFPTWARCLEVFDASIDHALDTVSSLTPAKLEAMVPWTTSEISGADLVVRMVFHNGAHSGQIIDLRRGLGLGRVLK